MRPGKKRRERKARVGKRRGIAHTHDAALHYVKLFFTASQSRFRLRKVGGSSVSRDSESSSGNASLRESSNPLPNLYFFSAFPTQYSQGGAAIPVQPIIIGLGLFSIHLSAKAPLENVFGTAAKKEREKSKDYVGIVWGFCGDFMGIRTRTISECVIQTLESRRQLALRHLHPHAVMWMRTITNPITAQVSLRTPQSRKQRCALAAVLTTYAFLLRFVPTYEARIDSRECPSSSLTSKRAAVSRRRSSSVSTISSSRSTGGVRPLSFAYRSCA